MRGIGSQRRGGGGLGRFKRKRIECLEGLVELEDVNKEENELEDFFVFLVFSELDIDEDFSGFSGLDMTEV